MSEPQVVTLAQVAAAQITDGVTMRAIFGEAAMLSLVELDPGAAVPMHSHPHEQLGYVLSGEIVMLIGGKEHRLQPGAAYAIPGGSEHSGIAGAEGCAVLDIFRPIREDYRALAEDSA